MPSSYLDVILESVAPKPLVDVFGEPNKPPTMILDYLELVEQGTKDLWKYWRGRDLPEIVMTIENMVHNLKPIYDWAVDRQGPGPQDRPPKSPPELSEPIEGKTFDMILRYTIDMFEANRLWEYERVRELASELKTKVGYGPKGRKIQDRLTDIMHAASSKDMGAVEKAMQKLSEYVNSIDPGQGE